MAMIHERTGKAAYSQQKDNIRHQHEYANNRDIQLSMEDSVPRFNETSPATSDYMRRSTLASQFEAAVKEGRPRAPRGPAAITVIDRPTKLPTRRRRHSSVAAEGPGLQAASRCLPTSSEPMEVASAPTRRSQPATTQPSNQPQAPRSGEYQLTELKNVPTRTGRVVSGEFEQGEKAFPTIDSSIDEELALSATASESQSRDVSDEDFQLRLINAVRENPCLYDPLNEYYRDKPENTKFRLRVWDQIAEELHWQSDLTLLIDEWDRLRDLYIQKKTERAEDGSDRLCVPDFLCESMQWIDEYIFEDGPLSTQSHISLSPTNTQDVYFNEVNHDVMISGYQQPSQSTTAQRLPQSESHSGGYILLRQASPSGGQTTIRLVNTTPGGSENSNRNTATSTQAQKAGAGSSTSASRPQRVHIVHPPTSSSSQFVQKVPQEGITVTASGNAGMVGSVKKDTMTMVVDPSTYYSNGAQKVYRLVNVSDLDSGIHPPPRKRIAVMQKQPARGSSAVAGPRGQLGDDIIIDDGIEERTVVIEQHDTDSPLLGDSPLSTMMVSGHQAIPRGSQSRHMQLAMSDQLRPQTRIVPSSPQHHSPSLGAGYIQSQYDADLQFQQFISQNLSVLNDDEKAIAKMHIQKILMDARFGQGTCLRIMQEEEMASQTDAGGPSSTRDGTQTLDM
ncbi:MADF domain-containing protein [Trichostrongylus colubriformis]|uniref:MADF domain-containing protein n=1 Tax=Trichostrongylus colubriformis TaxID=6319 RepID=A0AAN8IND2_TRICO